MAGHTGLSRRLTVHDERAVLATVSKVISSSPLVEDVFPEFAAALRPTLPWDRIVIAVLDQSGDSFVDAYVAGIEIPDWAAGSEHPIGDTMTGKVAKAKKPVVLQAPTAAQAARSYPALATGLKAGLRAALSVPLEHQGRTYGALHLRSRRRFPYTEKHARLAEAISRQVAGAIANSWLLREIQREAQERSVLAELGVIITSSPSLDQLYGKCARKIRELMSWDTFAVSIVDPESSSFHDAYLWATDGVEKTGGPRMSLPGTFTERVIERNRGFSISADTPKQFARKLGPMGRGLSENMAAAMAVPLRSEGRPFGVLHFRSRDSRAFTQSRVRLAERIADQIAGAVANALQLEKTSQESRERAVIAECARSVAAAENVGAVFDRLAALIQELIPFDRIDISVAGRDGATYAKEFIRGLDLPGWGLGTSHRTEGTATGLVLKTARPLLVDDLADPDAASEIKTRAAYTGNGLRGVIAVPLIHRGSPIGVLQLMSARPNVYSHRHVSLAERIGAYIAPALENARLLTETRDAMHRAVENEEHLRSVLDASTDAILTVDSRGRILAANRAAVSMLRFEPEDVPGLPLQRLAPQGRSTEVIAVLTGISRQLPDRPAGSSSEIDLLRRDGNPFPAELSVAPIKDSKPPSLVFTIRDITARRAAERNLETLATTDHLTGLANRYQFGTLLRQVVRFAVRRKTTGALLYMDLDNFKYVNDTYGHSAGDRILKKVAEELRAQVRSSDIVARTGGDEFSLILQDLGEADAVRKARELVKHIESARFFAGAERVPVTASCGVVCFPVAAAQVSVDDLVAFADMAMYRAKESGRGSVQLLRPGIDSRTATTALQRTRLMIVDALEHGRLALHSQPIVDLKTGAIALEEILVRLVDSSGQLRSPAEFIPDAENLDLVQIIDRAVLGKVFGLLAREPGDGKIRRVSVNVSARSLNADFVDWVATTARDQGLTAGRLSIEITETAAMRGGPATRALLSELGALGIPILLDDFGSGFTMFQQLRDLQLAAVKVDGSVVRSAVRSDADRRLLEALTSLAHALGLQVIAEHVEDESTAEVVKLAGADLGQGYLYGRPAEVLPAGPLSPFAAV